MALRRASDRATSKRSGFKDFVSPRTICTCTGYVPNKNCQKYHSIAFHLRGQQGPSKVAFGFSPRAIQNRQGPSKVAFGFSPRAIQNRRWYFFSLFFFSLFSHLSPYKKLLGSHHAPYKSFFNSKNDDQIYMEKLYIPVSIQKSNLNIQT